MLPPDCQDPKDKAGDSADTCAQAFKTAPDTHTMLPNGLSEREERGNVLSGLFLFSLMLFKVHPWGVHSLTLPDCVTWPCWHLLGKSNSTPCSRLPRSVGRSLRLCMSKPRGAETQWTWLLL